MRKITILLTFLFLVGIQFANAQQRTISGKVISSEDGQGIPGVSISVKGTTIGTVTDVDGNFSMAIDELHRTLVFQYLGMKTQEMDIGNSTQFNITMAPDALLMEEVVVTALGISREKKALGYAVQELDGDEVNRVKSVNFVQSLSGKSSGVDIKQANTMGGSANVVIRGTASLTQNNQALFVVDGVPFNNTNTSTTKQALGGTSQTDDGWGGYDYGNNAADINPEDIESVSVLKGAAATALYGSRAANGVILITTKKGSMASTGKKKIGVTLNMGYTAGKYDKSTAPQWQNSYGAGYGPFYENEGVSGVGDYYFFYADLDGDGQKDLITPTSEDASWGAKFDPNLQVIQWDALDPTKSNYAEKRPWQPGANGLEYYFQTTQAWNTNLSIDAANEFGAFRLSYTNYDETGLSPNSRISRNNINFQGSYNLTKKFRVEANMSYIYTWAYGRAGTGYDGQNPMQSFGQWFERNVDQERLNNSWLRSDGSQLSWNSSYYDDLTPIYFANPYWVRNKNVQDDNRDRFFGYLAATWDIIDHLSFSARFSGDVYTTEQNERIAYGGAPDVPYYGNYIAHFQEFNTELMLRYNQNFNNWSVSAMLGANFRQDKNSTNYGRTVGGLVVPDLYTVSNSVSPVSVTQTEVNTGVNSLFGMVSAGFKNFIYLDVTGRNDWSSTLPSGENSYFYPGVSLSFVLSELGGLNDVSWMSLLKLRGNYAEVGNDAPAYATASTYTQNTSWGDLALFSVNSTLQNPNLKPERTKSWEIGLEGSFLKNRLGFDFAYYNATSSDQILPVLVSPFSGVSRKWVNGGEIQNKGWELGLTGTPIESKNWRWDIGVNWWQNKNEVLSLYEGVDNLLIYSAWDVSINATVGQPYGTIRGTDFIYTNGKKTVNENGYYMMTSSDTVIGSIQPDWKMGIPTTLTWKGLSLYLMVDIQKGGDIYSVNTKYGQATGLYAETAGLNSRGVEMRDPVDEGGGYLYPETVFEDGSANDIYVPAYRWGRAFYYNNSPTARYVFDASYVKLRELSISYSLPSKLFENSIVREVRFALVGRNLWIISKNVDHFDPEAQLSSGNQQGIETGSYPSVKTFGFNFTLGF